MAHSRQVTVWAESAGMALAVLSGTPINHIVTSETITLAPYSQPFPATRTMSEKHPSTAAFPSRPHARVRPNLQEIQSATIFHALAPSLAPHRIDLPSYFYKTDPKSRPDEFMQQLYKYASMMKQLRESEEALVRQRMAILELEKWLLSQEGQDFLPKRIDEADKELKVAHVGWLGEDGIYPYAFRPFPALVGSSMADTERRIAEGGLVV